MDDEKRLLLQDAIVQAGKFIEQAAAYLAERHHNGRTALGAARGLHAHAQRLEAKCDRLVTMELALRATKAREQEKT